MIGCDTPHAAVTCVPCVDHEKCSQQETLNSPPICTDLAGFVLFQERGTNVKSLLAAALTTITAALLVAVAAVAVAPSDTGTDARACRPPMKCHTTPAP